MPPVSTNLRYLFIPRRLGGAVVLFVYAIAVGVHGTEDTLHTSTATATKHSTLHSVSRDQRGIQNKLFNIDLQTDETRGRTTKVLEQLHVGKRQRSVKYFHGAPARNGRHRVSTYLYGTDDTEHTAERRNDNIASRELSRGDTQSNEIFLLPLWNPIIKSTSGTKSLVTDSLKNNLTSLEESHLKTKSFRNAYIPKTALCNCFVRRIPLTHRPNRPVISTNKNRNLWLFINYCNKCFSIIKNYTFSFGSHVIYQICHNRAKCATYSQFLSRDLAQSENNSVSQFYKIEHQPIQNGKDNEKTFDLRDGNWSRFRREFHDNGISKKAVYNRSTGEHLLRALKNLRNIGQKTISLRTDSLNLRDLFGAPKNGSEHIALRSFRNPRKRLLSNGVRFVKFAGRTFALITSSVLGVVVTSILNKAGDEQLADAVRDVVGGLGRAVSGASVIGGKMVQSIV